jgi:hypothetical protein
MGWLFALWLGLQHKSERVIWLALLPIAAGHTLSVGLVAVALLAGLQWVSLSVMRWVTAASLLGFGVSKLFTFYRHPRWVGMKVGYLDLLWWSFLMATAHGAGIMIAPALLGISGADREHWGSGHEVAHGSSAAGLDLALGVALHTLAMLVVMGAVAWIVYRRVGLAALRKNWINFDLMWAVTLVVVGAIAVVMAAA